MRVEEKSLKIIIVSDKECDLNQLNNDVHKLTNSLAGEARKNFLESIKNDQEFGTDVDLIIRLNGSKSLNNSVITEACYAEIYFSDKNENEFSQKDLDTAITDFHRRKRNFGA